MRQAMEISLREEQEKNQQIDQEEEEIMKRVIEMSEREEKERQHKVQEQEINQKKQIEEVTRKEVEIVKAQQPPPVV